MGVGRLWRVVPEKEAAKRRKNRAHGRKLWGLNPGGANQRQTGYGAFSVSESGQNAVREYILHQQQHHAKRSFKEEFSAFLQKNHFAIDSEHLWS